METLDLLRVHAARWPCMEPQDAVKLLYQQSFGGGHLLEDGLDAAHNQLETERQNVKVNAEVPAVESIGDGRIRLHLNAPETANLPTEWIWRMFCSSIRRKPDSEKTFRARLETIVTVAEEGVFAFSTGTARQAVDDYLAGGIQPVSHSEPYCAAYHPSYRVMNADAGRLFPLLTALQRKKEHHTPVLLGIDGDAAAGKTTLAAQLAEILDCPVVHMDDFFLPSTLRTSVRLAKPGGNIHYERLWEKVIEPLCAGKPFAYQPYDCHQDDFLSPVTIPSCEFAIVEGSYALHPQLQQVYELRLFLSVDPETQRTRIYRRNGSAMLQRFLGEWIPMEKRYQKAFGIADHCTFNWTAEPEK